MAAKKSFPFESTLKKLEAIVEQMESGDLTLEESLRAFEEGIQLTRACQQALTEAQQQINVLIEKNGTLATEPMTDASDEF
jgi:exodeoxyribonuclease VII small subunit